MTTTVKTVKPGEYGDRLLADPAKYLADVRAEYADSMREDARRKVEAIFGPPPTARRRWFSARP